MLRNGYAASARKKLDYSFSALIYNAMQYYGPPKDFPVKKKRFFMIRNSVQCKIHKYSFMIHRCNIIHLALKSFYFEIVQ